MASPPPLSRTEAAETLEEGWQRLRSLLHRLSEDDMTRPATIGGGEWSAKDLLGHIASWEQRALEVVQAFRQDAPIPPGEETDAFNARTVAAKRDHPVDRVWADSERVHGDIVGAVRGLTEEQWSAPVRLPGRDEPIALGALLGGVTAAEDGPFRHAYDHLPDLEAFVETVVPPG